MVQTTRTIRSLVERASYYFERNNDCFSQAKSSSGKDPAGYIHQLIHTLSSDGDTAKFYRFLDFSGLKTNELQAMMSGVRLKEDAPLPDWALTIQKAQSYYQNEPARAHNSHRFIRSDQPIPFEEIFTPFVTFFQDALKAKTGKNIESFSEQALIEIEREILNQLTYTAGRVLWDKFSKGGYLSLAGNNKNTGSREGYLSFVSEIKASGLLDLLQEYPVLARIIGMCFNQSVDVYARFIKRLHEDLPVIATNFFEGRNPGQVKELKLAAGDKHNGGEAVILLKFSSGEKIVYKPREMAVALTFNKVVDWIKSQGESLEVKTLQILDRHGYGWIEYIDSKSCDQKDQIRRYYRRAGELACICYILEGADLHAENLIAHGEYPIILDYENFFTSYIRIPEEATRHMSSSALEQALKERRSIHRTYLFPIDFSASGVKDNAIAGFGSCKALEPVWQMQVVDHNTDQMQIVRRLVPPMEETHIPYLNDQPQRLSDYVEELVTGFTRAYRICKNLKSGLLAFDGPLAGSERLPIRFVFRNTFVYMHILQKLRAPKYLQDGRDYSIGLEILGRAYLKKDQKPAYWAFMEGERYMMTAQDVPFFRTTTASRDIETGHGEQVSDYFEMTGYEAVVAKITLLDEDDLAEQATLIRSLFSDEKIKTTV